MMLQQPNGLRYPPPLLARLLTHYRANSRKKPLNPHAEGGRVGAVLGGLELFHS